MVDWLPSVRWFSIDPYFTWRQAVGFSYKKHRERRGFMPRLILVSLRLT